MQPSIRGQLWVKAQREDVALAQRDGTAIVRRYHLCASGRLHER
jgi:hypothetical protein